MPFCSVPEDHPAEALGVRRLPVGFAVLDARLFVRHPGRAVVRTLRPPPPPSAVIARVRHRFPGFFARFLPVAACSRRWRRLFARSPRRWRRVQGPVVASSRRFVDADQAAAGAVHRAGQQQRGVEDDDAVRRSDGGVRGTPRQGPAHPQFDAHHHPQDAPPVQPVQPVQEGRQEPVPDHRRAGQRPSHTAQTGLPVQA